MSVELTHLTVAAVKAIHREVLRAHGGSPGIGDETLLESAVAAPQATMMGSRSFAIQSKWLRRIFFTLPKSSVRRWQQTNRTRLLPRFPRNERTHPSEKAPDRMSGNLLFYRSPPAKSIARKRRNDCADWCGEDKRRVLLVWLRRAMLVL